MELRVHIHVSVTAVDKSVAELRGRGFDEPIHVRVCGVSPETCRVLIGDQRWRERAWRSEDGATYEAILGVVREARDAVAADAFSDEALEELRRADQFWLRVFVPRERSTQ